MRPLPWGAAPLPLPPPSRGGGDTCGISLRRRRGPTMTSGVNTPRLFGRQRPPRRIPGVRHELLTPGRNCCHDSLPPYPAGYRRRGHDVAAGARPRPIAGPQDRRAERPVRPLHEHRRPDLGDLCQAGARGFRRRHQGPERPGHHRRPPEQAGPRGVDLAPVDRPRRRGRDPRRADLVGGARGAGRGAREEQGLPRRRPRHHRADRRAVLAQLHHLGLRHLHAGEIDRRRDGQGRRR